MDTRRGLLVLALLAVGQNHLGDLNQFLPTVHGFDEFSRCWIS